MNESPTPHPSGSSETGADDLQPEPQHGFANAVQRGSSGRDSSQPRAAQEEGTGQFEQLNPVSLLNLARQSGPRQILDESSIPESMSAAALQDRFPDLEILECIGRGGMGFVYKARQKRLDRVVALKVLTPELSGDAKFQERFAREARTLARLSHPHIVTLHDFGCVDDIYYLVMEYMDGMNLRELLQAQTLTESEMLDIIPALCRALQYAHSEGVVHRDIKPENILFDSRGHVKLADFGLAKLATGSALDPTLTATAQFMGTPYYMAPEQWKSDAPADHRVDLYAMGVVIYELLTGQLPLGHFELPSRLARVSPAVDEVVMRSLQSAPENRYQSAEDVQRDLDRIAKGAVFPERVVPVLPPQVQDARDKVVHAARATVVPFASWAFESVKSLLMMLPLPTIAACILVVPISFNTWLVATFDAVRQDLPYPLRYHVERYGRPITFAPTFVSAQEAAFDHQAGPVERPPGNDSNRRVERMAVPLTAWESSILVNSVRLENYWLVFAACTIGGLALLRFYLGGKAELFSIAIASYGIAHVYAIYRFQEFAIDGVNATVAVQITASPLAVGAIFVCLLLASIWKLCDRTLRLVSDQPRTMGSVCRSFYRVVFEDTRLF